MTLLAKIDQTPGLLETFKRICAEASPAPWQALSADEKALFELYKQALVQA